MKMESLDSCILCGGDGLKVIDKRANISKCMRCGHVFNNPRPIFEEIEDYYAESCTYDQWLSEEKRRDEMWKKRLGMVKKARASGRLLDVGSGTGQFLKFAREAYDVTGTEISFKAIEIAKELYDVELIHGDLAGIDFGDKKFDVITIFHVLEHVPDPAAVIRKCRELLEGNGILVIAVPNDVHSLTSPIKRLLALLKIGKWRHYGKSGLPNIAVEGIMDEIHLSHFKTSVLKRYLVDSDFSILETGLDPYNIDTGLEGMVQTAFYWFCWSINKIFSLNLYDTIWVACGKSAT
jgi:2-polyprenyl-3-methyl-5-hydroxy-6-metoxy-1,4-benzoquinol methylase